MRKNKWVWFALGLAAIGGCDDGGDDVADGGGGGGDAAAADDCSGGATVDPMSSQPSAETATVTGKVVWDGEPAVPGGMAPAGDLYIAALANFSASCPDPNVTPEPPLAQVVIRCADLTSGELEYTLPGLPPNTDFTLVPFLDVNRNVDPSSPTTAGPDGCDLTNTGAMVTSPAAGESVEAELDLSVGGGFIAMLCGYPACGS